MRRLVAGLCLCMCADAAAPALAAEHEAAAPVAAVTVPVSRARPLVDLVRELQRVQDGVAAGIAEAPARQVAMLAEAGALVREIGAPVCEDHAGVRALVVLLLGGGDPAWADVCAQATKKPNARDERLLRGAAAYAAGQGNVAQNAFSGLDPLDLDPSLAGQFALVRASLVAGDRPLGLHLLDLARLFGTGGLVEEAAIRQEIFVLAGVGDTEKFSLLARQYILRFPKSLYADNFVQGFVRGAVDLGLTSDDRRFAELREAIDRLKPSAALSVYLLIARRGLLTGEFAGARRAATAARSLAPAGSPEAARTSLYDAAANVVSVRWRDAGRTLQAIDPARLPLRDVPLREAALTLAARIGAPTTAAATDTSPSPTMKRAVAALERAETSLSKAKR